MNGSTESEAENKASALLKFYTLKVCSRIKSPENANQKTSPHRKNRSGRE
jgi:hypothetical protein